MITSLIVAKTDDLSPEMVITSLTLFGYVFYQARISFPIFVALRRWECGRKVDRRYWRGKEGSDTLGGFGQTQSC